MLNANFSLKHIFGLKGDVKDNTHYIDDNRVLYPAGYNIVVYNTEKKVQQFIPLVSNGDTPTTGTGDISAMRVSSVKGGHTSKSKILAVAERGERARVTVFDLNTFKRRARITLDQKEIISTEVVSIAFSPDGKYMLVQCGAPDWTLVNIQWEKGRALQYAKVSNQAGAPIHQCSFCPTDPSVVCVTGNGILRFLHLEQNEFKSIPFSMGKREPQNYLCHVWIDDRILVGTDTGDVLVFENAEFRGVLESSPSDGSAIESIVSFSKGFVCGCDEGMLHVFERDEKEFYKQSKSFQIDGNYVKIKNLSVSPSEDNVVCTLENNQAFVLGLSNTDILKSEDMNFEPLSSPFHHMQITGLDVCMRKPLVVTCGLDRSVRVWNYITHTIEVMRFFNEAPSSVAFHPSGLHILVGFSDNLRLCNLLMDEIRPYKDFSIKGCSECRFSNGGQYFAAANGTIIQVFNTWTCEMVFTSNFNTHKGRIRSLIWTPDDSRILSAAADGCVYVWKHRDPSAVATRAIKCRQKLDISCIVQSSDGSVYCASSDETLKVVQYTESESGGELKQNVAMGGVLTQLVIPSIRPPEKTKMLFGGTETGVVRSMEIPIEGATAKPFDLHIHSGAISRMRMSPDDQLLFTVGEDGCIAIFQVDGGKDSGERLGRARHDQNLPWAEEILVTRSDLEDQLAMMTDLQNKVEELQNHNELQLQLRDMTYREKLRDVTERYKTELDVDRKKYRQLEDEKESMERHYAHKVERLNTLQSQKMDELNQHHKEKLTQETDRFQAMQQKIRGEKLQQEESIANREALYLRDKEELTVEYEEKLRGENDKRNQIESEKSSVLQDFDETKQLMEEDADIEIDELKANYDKKLAVERRTTLNLKDQNAILKRKFGALRDDINDNLDDLQAMKVKQVALYAQIDGLEKDIKGHMKEIKERESTIGDKVHRIFELRKKNQELEKFKFVLDYKITELKRQILPRKLEMNQMSEQIDQMQTELKGYKKDSVHLKLEVRELKLKLAGMEKEILQNMASRDEIETRIRRFKTELHEVYLGIDSPKELKEGIKRLYQRHVTSDLKTAVAGAEDVHKDYKRQRHYLERSVDSLNMKLTKDMMVHRKENLRILQENIALITEINTLRREMKAVKDQQRKQASQSVGSQKISKKSFSKDRDFRRQQMEADMETQQEQIRALRGQLGALQGQLETTQGTLTLQGQTLIRPGSAERLPPL